MKNKNQLTPEENFELEEYFEDSLDVYCCDCTYFNDYSQCPFYENVYPTSNWRDIGCEKFYS